MVPPRAKQGKWTEDALEGAIEAVTKRLLDYKAAAEYNIPCRTLRKYVNKNITEKAKFGRKFTLSEEQQNELCTRNLKLAEVGYPITQKILRLCVYKFCTQNRIKHQFSDVKKIATHKWARSFMKTKSNHCVSKSSKFKSRTCTETKQVCCG
ncbi:hypothetical protein Zmor_011402 [Zophobas morio]|uniref:HTH psq-type domain-containing protein n=1 Tax=Zophobas morio TaxID=2755281 RepID=A0AA38IKN1_9CUCU|nr:hypothetical protein Zmor_011402 [Zophobas morio]